LKPEVDILICAKNNQDIISKCIKSVQDQTYSRINCFVLDDDSTDYTLKIIEKEFSFVKVIKLNGLGPSHNRNIGIAAGKGKYIVTMDSDSVLDFKWVEKMVDFMEKNPNVGLASGKILYENRKDLINVAGAGMSKTGIVVHYGEGCSKKEFNETKKVIYLCSAAMIVRRSVLDKIGGFDADYFYGHEDLDICWRANLAGFDVVYYPFAESYHEQNGTVKKMPGFKARFLASRNRTLTLLKNYELVSLIKYSPLFFAHFVYLMIFRNHRLGTLKGYFWNLVHFRETLEKRKHINKIRKVKDRELF
jgi:hypothetical protein